jgi:hypothetical protein
MALVRTDVRKAQNGPRVKNPATGAYPGCSASSCKSLQPQIWRKSAEIPPTFQRAFLNREYASSNPPRSASQSLNLRLLVDESDKCPPIAAFRELTLCLCAPKLNNLSAKSPIVSSPHMKYSRFWETCAGDRARSALRGVGRSLAQRFSRAIWHIGTSIAAPSGEMLNPPERVLDPALKMCGGLCPERAEIGWFRFAHRVQSR